MSRTRPLPNPGQQWKCGDEFLPFHPKASHVPAEYRDGWNRCYAAAMEQGVSPASADGPLVVLSLTPEEYREVMKQRAHAERNKGDPE